MRALIAAQPLERPNGAVGSHVTRCARPRRVRVVLGLLAVLSCLSASCGAPQRQPEPLLLSGSTAALGAALEHCAAFSGGALPRRCARAAERLGQLTCPRVEASCADESCDLLAALQCEGGDSSSDLANETAGAQVLESFSLRGPLWLGGKGAVEIALQATVDAESLSAELELEPGTRGTPDWFRRLPRATPERNWLSGTGAVLHARWFSPAGFGLEEALSRDEQRDGRGARGATSGAGDSGALRSMGERLYGLRNELFSRTVLDGKVELVVYPPREEGEFPEVTLAVGTRLRAMASAAMESYLDEMQLRWPFRRSPLRMETWIGTCVTDLRMLPELAPCYVATDQALVVGWNRSSLERALGATAPRGAESRVSSQLSASVADDGDLVAHRRASTARGADLVPIATLDFERLALANRRLAQARDATPGVPRADFGFAHAVLRAATADEPSLRFRVSLER